jgi:hypothetical protein
MKAQACIFKRNAQQKNWERAIIIGTDSDETKLVVDKEGQPVAELYDFRLAPELGCFEFKDT